MVAFVIHCLCLAVPIPMTTWRDFLLHMGLPSSKKHTLKSQFFASCFCFTSVFGIDPASLRLPVWSFSAGMERMDFVTTSEDSAVLLTSPPQRRWGARTRRRDCGLWVPRWPQEAVRHLKPSTLICKNRNRDRRSFHRALKGRINDTAAHRTCSAGVCRYQEPTLLSTSGHASL